jgi:hypothetical protein
MPETLMNLGQTMPLASTLTDVYTVPGGTTAAVSSILICNQNTSGSNANIRMSLAVGGAADTGFPGSQYFCYAILNPQNMMEITVGISMGTGDVLRCYSDQSNVSFLVSGVQVT